MFFCLAYLLLYCDFLSNFCSASLSAFVFAIHVFFPLILGLGGWIPTVLWEFGCLHLFHDPLSPSSLVFVFCQCFCPCDIPFFSKVIRCHLVGIDWRLENESRPMLKSEPQQHRIRTWMCSCAAVLFHCLSDCFVQQNHQSCPVQGHLRATASVHHRPDSCLVGPNARAQEHVSQNRRNFLNSGLSSNLPSLVWQPLASLLSLSSGCVTSGDHVLKNQSSTLKSTKLFPKPRFLPNCTYTGFVLHSTKPNLFLKVRRRPVVHTAPSISNFTLFRMSSSRGIQNPTHGSGILCSTTSLILQ